MDGRSDYRATLDEKAPARVTFIGDLHGKPGVLAAILRARGLPEEGDEGHLLVVLGDFLDRGVVDERGGALRFVGAHAVCDRLVELRRRWPGAVRILMGNHEMAHLEDVAERKLGPGQRSRFLGLGDLPLTAERLDLLTHLPLALRLERDGDGLVAVHAGIPRDAARPLAELLPYRDVFAAAASPFGRCFAWNDPAWRDWLGLFGCYGREDLLRFLRANDARWFLRGHRVDSWMEDLDRREAIWNLHSSSGPRCEETADQIVAWVEWDRGKKKPLLVQRPMGEPDWRVEGLEEGNGPS